MCGYRDTCGNYVEYMGGNLNTTISFKYADIGICVVIRPNTGVVI